MSQCPYCQAEVENVPEEVEHMQAAHSDIIAARLEAAGFVWSGEHWVDRYSGAVAPATVNTFGTGDEMPEDLTFVGLRRRVEKVESAQSTHAQHGGLDVAIAYALIQIAQDLNEIKHMLAALDTRERLK